MKESARTRELAFLEATAHHTLELFPCLADVRVLRQWAGICDMTPDYSPIMGEVPAVVGFYLDVGRGTYGFKAGPVSARRMAELIPTGRTPDLLKPFAITRFWEDALVGEKAAAAVTVHKFVCAIDCGIAVNPDQVKAQMEGGLIYALTAALMGEITVDKERVQQTNFHTYPMLRIAQAPPTEVHILDSGEAPGGLGEPGVPTVASALCNAIFAATGKRVRRLPIRADDLKKA